MWRGERRKIPTLSFEERSVAMRVAFRGRKLTARLQPSLNTHKQPTSLRWLCCPNSFVAKRCEPNDFTVTLSHLSISTDSVITLPAKNTIAITSQLHMKQSPSNISIYNIYYLYHKLRAANHHILLTGQTWKMEEFVGQSRGCWNTRLFNSSG